MNLFDALERIRDSKLCMTIWVDAICINQEDIDERSAQVKQMADIYSAARRVLIWIGDGHPEEAQVCFNLVEEVNALSRRLLAQHRSVADIPSGSYDAALSCVTPEAWISVRHLMEASWFTRIWTIQEVGLARSAVLLYGKSEFDWTELVEFMMFVADRPDIAQYAGDVRAGRIWDTFESIWCSYANTRSWRDGLSHMTYFADVSPTHSFLDIANVARAHTATDPRDHIYALLGHPSALRAGSTISKITDVDYNKSVTEVYTALATYTISYDQVRWTTLSSVDHTDGTPALKGQRPSWVPWWNEGWRVYWLGYTTMWYRAGGSDTLKFQAKVLADNSLHLGGIVFDQIAWTSQALTKETVLAKRSLSADPIQRTWVDLRQVDVLSRYGDARESEIAFSLVTVAGRARDEGPAEEDLPLHEMVYDSSRKFSASNQTSSNENTLELEDPVNLLVSSFVQNQARALHNRKIFRTRTGFYGVCHFNVRPGDFCTVFRGANIPFVLRSSATDERDASYPDSYRLIGEAYIQGVMNGEILDSIANDRLSAGFVEKNIIIR